VIVNVYDTVMKAVNQFALASFDSTSTEDQSFVQESTLFLTTALGKNREVYKAILFFYLFFSININIFIIF
jgi:hypothetical protein